MHSKSLRAAALVCLPLGVFPPSICRAQNAAALPSKPADNSNTVPGGLPTFLLKVPGGNVQMGTPVNEFVAACSQAAYPFQPQHAHRDAAKGFETALRLSSSMIGRKSVPVKTFYLAKWPVKNSEFAIYINKLRAAQVDVAPPLHWWRDGCPESYRKHLPKIRAEHEEGTLGALQYLELHGHTLPYKLLDREGKSIADHPVVFVSWRDAHAFAASVGMRLPTERELTRAMRADGSRTWPGVDNTPDVYTEELKTLLGMAKSSDQRRKPVGTVAGAAGPYGHFDLHGQVWQLVGDLGYQGIHGKEFFEDNWEEIERHPTARVLEQKPPFHDGRAIVKGGSFLSHGEPATLMVDSRVSVDASDALKSVGFRLAKSLTPGYDYLYSLQRVDFDSSSLDEGQDLELDRVLASERYTLAANGFPSDYQAVAFAPVNWLLDSKKAPNAKLKATVTATQSKPLLIGALASTTKFANGTKPGLYSVFYRQAGIPRDLMRAVKAGHKELVRARKFGKPSSKANRESKWRTVTKQFGLKDEDVISAGAADGNLGYVFVDGIKVPTNRDAFLLHRQGQMVSVLAGSKKAPTAGEPVASNLVMQAGKGDKRLAKLRFGIPLTSRDAARVKNGKRTKNVIAFELHALVQ